MGLLLEELPVIKEKVIEAGNGRSESILGLDTEPKDFMQAAKKKVMDLYNQFKASRAANSATASAGTTIPTTNAQYR